MAKTPVWRGSRLIHLQPGSLDEVQSSSGTKVVLAYRGPYITLRAQRPKIGQSISGYAGLTVEQTQTKPDGAGTNGPGTLTVTLSNETTPPDAVSSGGSDITVEIDAGQLQKSVYDNPKFSGLTNEEKAKIRKAVEDNKTEPPALVPRDNNINLASDLFYLLIGGTDSYLCASPTVKITTRSALRPTVGAIGRGTRMTAKPDPAAPAGYQWLKTGDRAVRQGRGGKWERVEEWTGADEWSPILYSNPA
jgi:hypothetical protein